MGLRSCDVTVQLTSSLYEAMIKIKSEERVRKFAEEELEHACNVVDVG